MGRCVGTRGVGAVERNAWEFGDNGRRSVTWAERRRSVETRGVVVLRREG